MNATKNKTSDKGVSTQKISVSLLRLAGLNLTPGPLNYKFMWTAIA
jgi:hypothetical protein